MSARRCEQGEVAAAPARVLWVERRACDPLCEPTSLSSPSVIMSQTFFSSAAQINPLPSVSNLSKASCMSPLLSIRQPEPMQRKRSSSSVFSFSPQRTLDCSATAHQGGVAHQGKRRPTRQHRSHLATAKLHLLASAHAGRTWAILRGAHLGAERWQSPPRPRGRRRSAVRRRWGS